MSVAKRGGELREHILWTAREVFLEAGFERTSMEVVAKRAGTTKRTLYGHFANKEALFLAVFEMLRGYFLERLSTPDVYAADPAEALVLFCGRFLQTLLYEGAIQMCRVCASEAARYPAEAANYCYVVFTEVENRLAVYIASAFGLHSQASVEAAQRLLGQVLYPRFTRALFGLDSLAKDIEENAPSPDFEIGPIRRAVADLIASLREQKNAKA